MTEAVMRSAVGLDLSARVATSTTVVASPTGSAETIVASVTLQRGLTICAGVLLIAQAAWTVGTSGVSGRWRIRQTAVNGTVVADTGAVTEVAANLDSQTVVGFDTAPADGQVYKLCLIVASGAAASTVSAVTFVAVVV